MFASPPDGSQDTRPQGESGSASEHYLRQELETLFRDNPAMWTFLQTGSLDGVWYWNLEKPDDEWMSPEFWRLFGVDPATKQHNPAEWQTLIFADDLATALENFQAHCADPNVPYDQLVRYRHADGSTVWVRCRGIAIRDENGRAVRMLGAHNDVTALKRAEERANSEADHAHVAMQEMQAFAYGVAHDLKAPTTTSLRLMDAVLEEDARLSRDQIDYLDYAKGSLQRMRTLVDEVLLYASFDGNADSFASVDVNTLVADVFEDCKADLNDVGGRCSVGPLPSVHGNAAQIGRAVMNLVSNAIKYRRRDTPVHISITGQERTDSMVEISVTDNAMGIEPQFHGKVFDLFQRLHRHDEIPGSGLGLALCRRAATLHGGSIELDSTPGVGSTFSLVLPRART